MKLSAEASDVIKIVNLLAIMLIVAIHYHTRNFPGYFEVNFIVQEFIHNVIGRSAVPLFAALSGFLFFAGKDFDLEVYWRKLLSRIQTILLPCLLIIATTWLYKQLEWYWSSGNGVTTSVWAILNSLLFYPIGSQFWFIRDLLILIVLSPYIFVLVHRFAWVLPVALMLTWFFDLQPFPLFKGKFFIHIEMLAFFVLGAYCSIAKLNVSDLKLIKPSFAPFLSILLIYFFLAALRIYVEPRFGAWYSRIDYPFIVVCIQKSLILMGIYILFVLAGRLNRSKGKDLMLRLSGYSFFVFLVHDYPLKQILWKVMLELGVSQQWIFYLRLSAALLIMFMAAFILEWFFPRFFSWLSGGRNARRHALNAQNKTAASQVRARYY